MSEMLAPKAVLRVVRNTAGDRMSGMLGLILHVQEGSNSPYGWFNNPSSQASSTWWVGKDGTLEQYVADPHTRMWAQAAGNETYCSVETEGQDNEPLTDAQCQTLARLYAWGHANLGWPLSLAEAPGQSGFGWHGMGGNAWGGHFGCPGDVRKAQRAHILALAQPDPNPWHPHRLVQIHGHPQVWQMRLTNGTQLVKAPVPDPDTLAEQQAQGQTLQVLIDSPANNAKVAAIPVIPWS